MEVGALAKPDRQKKLRELFVFLFLAVLIWPVLAVGVVGGWGFLVWMYHVWAGPPGPR
jgi:nitrate reductase NapE